MNEFYYIVVEEWLYPTESGRNVLHDYDSLDAALSVCKNLAEGEEGNFEDNCHLDSLPATAVKDDDGGVCGFLISPKNGLDEFFYIAKVVKVKKSY